MENETELRPLRVIGRDIIHCWNKKPPSEATSAYAWPYVEALLGLSSPSDMYGMEYGDMIVAYLLSNLRNWRGEDARRIKKELQAHLDNHNKGKR